MKLAICLLVLVFQSGPVPTPQQPPSSSKPAVTAETAELGKKLLAVRRIYVDSFGDDALAKQIQAMVISSLSETKRFILTENKDKADAILRGTALEKSSQELHSFSEGAAAGTASGGFSQVGDVASGGIHASHVAAQDKNASTETIDDARVAVRLVAADGDVIWTTKQESKGAKYKGASADVADKVAKQLLRDLEKLDKSLNNSAP
jgi:hypothetical protein